MTQAAETEERTEVIPYEYKITQYSPFATKLAEFREYYGSLVYNFKEDPESLKKAKKDSKEIGAAIKNLDAIHDEIKAPLKIKTDLIDSERKRIKDHLLKTQDTIKKQVKNFEAEELAHVELLESKVNEILQLLVFVEDHTGVTFIPTSDHLKQRLSILDNITIDGSFEHRLEDAMLAASDVREQLNRLLPIAIEREAEAAELQELRDAKAKREDEDAQKEIQEKARIDAEEKVKDDRIKADQDAADLIAKAEQDKQDAIDNARKQADDAVQEEKERAANELAEKERQDKAESEYEKKRVANKEHREGIQESAAQSFASNAPRIGIVTAREIVRLIDAGEIKNITINY